MTPLAEAASRPLKEFISWLDEQPPAKLYDRAGSRPAILAEWLTHLYGHPIHLGNYSCSHVEKKRLVAHAPLCPWMKDLVSRLQDDDLWQGMQKVVNLPNSGSFTYVWPHANQSPNLTPPAETYTLEQWRKIALPCTTL